MSTLSANTTIRGGTQPFTRCTGSQAQQAPFRTAGTPADGFLSYRFLPLCEPADELPGAKMAEKGFFKSLAHLSRHYGIEPMNVSDFAYPANILLAYSDVSQKIKTKGRARDLMIAEQHGNIGLTVKESIDTGHTLFYIPVLPLYEWHSKRQNRKTAELLIGICAYLYIHAGVPYYRDEDSYLGGSYAMMEDWVNDDMGDLDEEDKNRYQSNLNKVHYFGDVMGRRIGAKLNLEKLEERINSFKVNTTFQADCHDLAKRTLSLWLDHPKANLYRNEPIPDVDDEDYSYDGYQDLHIAEYVGFIGETKSYLYDSMMDMINGDLNERANLFEPQISTDFSTKPQSYSHSLAYEAEVFAIICDLCDLLNDLP